MQLLGSEDFPQAFSQLHRLTLRSRRGEYTKQRALLVDAFMVLHVCACLLSPRPPESTHVQQRHSTALRVSRSICAGRRRPTAALLVRIHLDPTRSTGYTDVQVRWRVPNARGGQESMVIRDQGTGGGIPSSVPSVKSVVVHLVADCETNPMWKEIPVTGGQGTVTSNQ